MAEQSEREILFKISVDVADSEQKIDKLKKSIDSLRDAQTKSSEEKKKRKTEETETTREIERQAEAVKKSESAIKSEAGSIAALRAENKKLTAERNTTTLLTEEGRKRVEELNKQLDTNNKIIKENVDAYTKQKIGIGGYKEAIEAAIPGVGGLMQSIDGLKKASAAFISTGFGAVIVGIGLAVSALIKYFQGSEEGQNKWNKIVQISTSLFEKLIDVVENVGEYIVGIFENPKQALKDFGDLLVSQITNRITGIIELIPALGNSIKLLFEGKFKEAGTVALDAAAKVTLGVEGATGKIKNFAKEISNTVDIAIKNGERIAALQAKIDRDERNMVIERARMNQEVSRIRNLAAQVEGDLRVKLIKDAIKLETDLSDKEVAAAKTKLDLAKLVLKDRGDDKEALKAVADATANVITAETARYDNTLRLVKELEGVEKQIAADEQKRRDDAEADRKKKADAELALRKSVADEISNDLKKREQEQADYDRKVADYQRKVENQKNAGIFTARDLLAKKSKGLATAFALAAKRESIADIIQLSKRAAVAAYLSATKSLPFPIGQIVGVIAGAGAIAYGAKQIADIAGVQLGFARGGRVLSGTRINSSHGRAISRSNGDNLLATVKTGEVILNERQQMMLGGARTFKKIGVPGFADGGFITPAVSGINQQIDFANSVSDSVSRIQPVLVLEDFELKQETRNTIVKTATVI